MVTAGAEGARSRCRRCGRIAGVLAEPGFPGLADVHGVAVGGIAYYLRYGPHSARLVDLAWLAASKTIAATGEPPTLPMTLSGFTNVGDNLATRLVELGGASMVSCCAITDLHIFEVIGREHWVGNRLDLGGIRADSRDRRRGPDFDARLRRPSGAGI